MSHLFQSHLGQESTRVPKDLILTLNISKWFFGIRAEEQNKTIYAMRCHNLFFPATLEDEVELEPRILRPTYIREQDPSQNQIKALCMNWVWSTPVTPAWGSWGSRTTSRPVWSIKRNCLKTETGLEDASIRKLLVVHECKSLITRHPYTSTRRGTCL